MRREKKMENVEKERETTGEKIDNERLYYPVLKSLKCMCVT